MKKFYVILAFLTMLPLSSTVVLGVGRDSGSGKNGGGIGKSLGSSSDICSSIAETSVDVILYGSSFEIPPNRIWDCPVLPNPFTSSQPATSLSDETKYYITIKVTTPDCGSYSKQYVWNVKGATMSIKVPSELTYKVYIAYYEQEGTWYNDPIDYSRTVWYFENVYYSDQDVHANDFKFSHKISKKRTIVALNKL